MYKEFCSKLKFITLLDIIFTNNYFLLKLINFVEIKFYCVISEKKSVRKILRSIQDYHDSRLNLTLYVLKLIFLNEICIYYNTIICHAHV